MLPVLEVSDWSTLCSYASVVSIVSRRIVHIIRPYIFTLQSKTYNFDHGFRVLSGIIWVVNVKDGVRVYRLAGDHFRNRLSVYMCTCCPSIATCMSIDQITRWQIKYTVLLFIVVALAHQLISFAHGWNKCVLYIIPHTRNVGRRVVWYVLCLATGGSQVQFYLKPLHSRPGQVANP